MPPPSPFTLGINYWPRRKAMYWWSDFDAGEVRDEFAVIHDVGMRLVRLFLLWEDWMPAPDTVNTAALGHLEMVADIAADQGPAAVVAGAVERLGRIVDRLPGGRRPPRGEAGP